MPKSQFIARLIGPVLSTVGIAMLVNPDSYREIAQQFLATSAFIYLSGVLLLTTGLAILNTHPLWTRDWRSIITLCGWMATVAGVWRLFAPKFVPFVGSAVILDHPNFFIGAGIVLIAFGGFITFKGYVSSLDTTEMETQP